MTVYGNLYQKRLSLKYSFCTEARHKLLCLETEYSYICFCLSACAMTMISAVFMAVGKLSPDAHAAGLQCDYLKCGGDSLLRNSDNGL